MNQPKRERANDIAATNRIIKILNPYLFFEKEMSEFISQRMATQIEEIKDDGLKAVAHGNLCFALNNAELGTQDMERALVLTGGDTITWLSFMQCTFWRMGPVEAAKIAKRGFKDVVSPAFLRDASYYAAASADYDFVKELHDQLVKMKKLDEMIPENGGQRQIMEKALACYEMASKAGKTEVVKALAEIMCSQLTLGQQLQAENRLINVSENEYENSFILEFSINNSTPKECSKMNLELISKRVDAEIFDWEIGCVFVSKEHGSPADACNSK